MELIWVAGLVVSAATSIGVGVFVLLSGPIVAATALVRRLVIFVVLVVSGSSIDDGGCGRNDGSHCKCCYVVDMECY